MEQDAGTASQATLNGDRDPEAIRRDIEHTREELGDTVAALAEKTDVKARAREKVDEIKHHVADHRDRFAAKAKEATPESVASQAHEHQVPLTIAAAVLLGYIAGRLSAR